MSRPEHTVQVQSPVSGVIAHRVAIGGGALAVLAGSILSVSHADEISSAPRAIIGLCLVSAAAIYMGVAASPYRAPFRRRDHAIVTLLALLAAGFDAASQLGTNEVLRDDWGPICIPLVLLGIGFFRPTYELLLSTGICCLTVGTIAVAESASFAFPGPPITVAIVAITPVLAMGLSSAVLSSAFFRSYERNAPAAADGPELRAAVEAAVRSRRLEALDDEVIPFLTSVLESGTISEKDSLRARRLASELRTVTVAQLDASWIDELDIDVDDPSRAAEKMSGEQRSAIRGLVRSATDPDLATTASMRLVAHDCSVVGTLRLERQDGERLGRGELAPYIAMIRTFFPTVHTEMRGTTLRVMFAYDA